MMEYDIHTVLDALTLGATAVVVFCMVATEMRASYQKEQDKLSAVYVVRACPPKARRQGPQP